MNHFIFPVLLAVVLVTTQAISGCRKKSDPAAPAPDAGSLSGTHVSQGVMKRGSVIVNDVTYSTAGSPIMHDDSPVDESFLRDGMTVKVRGRLNADKASGAADSIKIDGELTGTITAKGADSITLVGKQAFVDSRTSYINVANFQALEVGHWIEVYGVKDAQGRLLATCIEALTTGAGPAGDRLRGIAEEPLIGGDPPALSFRMGSLSVVTASGTMITPLGAAIRAGDAVEVQGYLSGSTFNAGRIDRQDLEDANFEPRDNESFDTDGFVSGFSSLNADFIVNGRTVRISGNTKFEDGAAADLLNNVRIEVEGTNSGGVLLADKVKFNDTIRLAANADADGKADVLGRIIAYTSLTELVDLAGGVTGITKGQGLRIRGFSGGSGGITATRIEGLSNPVDPDKVIIQGVVSSFNTVVRTLVVNGITINASGAIDIGEDSKPVTLDQFFSDLISNRTVVKARGAFNAVNLTLTANSVEIE